MRMFYNCFLRALGLIFFSLMLWGQASAQAVVYSENFDAPTNCDAAGNPWTASGSGAERTNFIAQSGSCSLSIGRVVNSTHTSPIIDLSAYTSVDISAWVYEERPNSGDQVDFQYIRSDGSWVTFEAYTTATNETAVTLDETLPSEAVHTNSRFRLLVVSISNGNANDRWHIDDFTLTGTIALGAQANPPPGSGSGSASDPFTSLAEAYSVSSPGDYYFNLGSGNFIGSVDTSEGGGWVLVAQYVHQGNTSPDLSVIGAGSDLPSLSFSTLGANESNETDRWGHAGMAAMSQFTGDIELRWYGETSGHSRKVHFRSTVGDNYVRTGGGSFSGIASDFTALSNHSANIPASVDAQYSSMGDEAMTRFPFYEGGAHHWGIRAIPLSNSQQRWEVDDFAGGPANDTIHRVWVRNVDTNYTVTTNADSGAGSLRAAIDAANASTTLDNITFDIVGAGPHIITLASALPTLTDDGISIDGTTQSGASCGNLWGGTPHTLKIEIQGLTTTGFDIIDVASANVNIRGLSLHKAGNTPNDGSEGIALNAASQSAVITCNYIGVKPDGTAGSMVAGRGVYVSGTNHRIGGLTAGDGNVLSTQGNSGVMSSNGAVALTVQGNFIGTDPTGGTAIGQSRGIGNGSGTATWEDIRQNLISGNTLGFGIDSNDIVKGVTVNSSIAGNLIGTDRTGLQALPNTGNGINSGAGGIGSLTIGGTSPEDRNIISGNGGSGINLNDVSNISILGNYIGTNINGTAGLGNGFTGISLDGATNIAIGDGTPAGRNVISNNGLYGVDITAAGTATLLGNYIGTDATGGVVQSNGDVGVRVDGTGSTANIGNGTTSGQNIIGGNLGSNILFDDSATGDVNGNLIGIGPNGEVLGSVLSGVYLADNGSAIIRNNTIAHNSPNGVGLTLTAGPTAIYSNSFFSNVNLAIDLRDASGFGLTPNDAGDSDAGPNDLLNFPLINTISANGTTTVNYSVELDVPANTEGYRIEFFKNTSPDTTNGEGEIFLGFVDTGDHTGGAISYDGAFAASEAVSVGDSISATTTRKTGATSYDITSEFAANVLAVSPLVVTNTNDSGTGSLRAAIDYANANAAEDNISFAIDSSGPHVISLSSQLPQIIDSDIIIDGSTQSGTVCNALQNGLGHTLQLRLDGSGITDAVGFDIKADNVTLRGFSVTGFDSQAIYFRPDGTNSAVDCLYVGLQTDGITKNANARSTVGSAIYVGGANAQILRSVISGNDTDTGDRGIVIEATGVVIIGNIIGLSANGTTSLGNGSHGIVGATGSSDLTIGGTNVSDRNIISANGADGINLNGVSNISILGNYIGVGADGSTDVGNTGSGIETSASTSITIGNGTSAGRNIVSSNNTIGIDIRNNSSATISDNYVGVASDGVTARGNRSASIGVQSSSTAMITRNIIAYSETNDGIELQGGTPMAAIFENAIFGNSEQAIELDGGGVAGEGVNENDVGDSDAGPNDLLNFPVINTITASGTTSVGYSVELDVPANTEGYRIEFYKNTSPDPTNGEGEIFLGFVDTGDHSGGAISYDGTFTSAVTVSVGDSVSATTTRKTGATSYDITSEFAANVLAVSPLVVTNTNDSGTGSLRAAIDYANANTAEDAISFDIPGNASDIHIITLTSVLPTVTDDGVSIDGTTQGDATCGDLWAGTPHTLRVRIDGANNNFAGLVTSANDMLVKGLSLTRLGTTNFNSVHAIESTSSSTNFVLQCSYLGLTPEGTAASNKGVAALAGGTSPMVGGVLAGQGNVISNSRIGILTGTGVSGAMIRGNFIGTDPTGLNAQGNEIGISHLNGAGTWSDVTKNLVSGSTSTIGAIALGSDDAVTPSDGQIKISGNYIGVDRTGTAALANAGPGIWFDTGSITDLTIGGTTATDRNVISGNIDDGIELIGISNVAILGNYIGVGADGVTDVGNSDHGILMLSSSDIDIGDGTALGRNIISGNDKRLIRLDNGGSNIAINDNYLGVDATGNTYVNMSGGAQDAIAIAAGSYANIDISNNVISGMPNEAIEVSVSGSIAGLIIQGNIIGFGKDESTVLPVGNASTGALEFRNNITVSGLKIGGDGVGEGNIIANSRGVGVFFNSNSGVSITGEVLGNTIYDNTSDGVQINGNANKVAIYGNSIHDNGGLGIDFNNDGVSANDSDNTGPNETLNFPVINDFASDGNTGMTYDVNLDVPAGDYRIDFYRNSAADSSGHGEGKFHLGFVELTHSGGNQQHTGTFTANNAVVQGNFIAATTTRKTGPSIYDITSEFSLTTTTGSPTELTAVKTVEVYDPTSAGLYSLPGNDVISSLTVTNPGSSPADADSIVIIDAIPAEVTFYNGPIDDVGGSNPISFVQTGGANLTFTYLTDVKYSNSGIRPTDMNGCGYTPSAGYDANVTFICLNPKGAMAAGNPDPTFTVAYRAKIK
jgi:hypothetical protein